MQWCPELLQISTEKLSKNTVKSITFCLNLTDLLLQLKVSFFPKYFRSRYKWKLPYDMLHAFFFNEIQFSLAFTMLTLFLRMVTTEWLYTVWFLKFLLFSFFYIPTRSKALLFRKGISLFLEVSHSAFSRSSDRVDESSVRFSFREKKIVLWRKLFE